eukprot:TRINITY_DN11671_c0_g1_i1.p1 TRINITY_DN11671_c0_g1~~TRINITY_DN11671_c0_g1_i1.p1  ORF type:complete len:527 (+),score=113.59 TRINITY_DN11671_c0_g1_i1:70-1650(+)
MAAAEAMPAASQAVPSSSADAVVREDNVAVDVEQNPERQAGCEDSPATHPPALSSSDPAAGAEAKEAVPSDKIALDSRGGAARRLRLWTAVCVASIAGVFVIDSMLLTVLVPLAPELLERFDVNGAMIGLLFSSKAIVQVVSSPLLAKMVYWFGPRAVFCQAAAVLVVTTALYASSGNSFILALFARSAQGIGSSGVLIGGQTGLSNLATTTEMAAPGESGNEGTLLSIASMGLAIGVLIGPTIGGVLASPEAFGIDGMFTFLAGISLAILLIVVALYYYLLPKLVQDRFNRQSAGADDPSLNELAVTTERVGLRQVLKMPKMWVILVANFCANFAIAMLEPVATVRMAEMFDIDTHNTGMLGALWAVAPLGFILAAPPSGLLADACRKNLVMLVGLLSMCAGLAVFAFSSSNVGGIALLEVALFCCGVGYAFVNNPAMAIVPSMLGDEGKSAGFSAVDMSNEVGFILGPLLGGAFGLGDTFRHLIATTVGVLLLVGVVLAMWQSPDQSPSKDEAQDASQTSETAA